MNTQAQFIYQIVFDYLLHARLFVRILEVILDQTNVIPGLSVGDRNKQVNTI